jgi:hypothetical protein
MRTRLPYLCIVGVAAACLLAFTGSSRGAGTRTPGGGGFAGCYAHVIGGLNPDYYDVYTGNCTGHDEPELDPVSSAPHSALNITWHVQLPAGGTSPVTSVGPTFWFGGTVKDSNPAKIGGEGFLELQIYPDSLVVGCRSNGGFNVHHAVGTYTACSPVWTLTNHHKEIQEPAAFNGMIMNPSATGPLIMHGRDVVDIHIWAPSMQDAYREQITDDTTGETSQILVLDSPTDGPLTPAFDTNEIGNSLDWGGVWDTPMAFVYEIGHEDIYGPNPGELCIPGQTTCASFNHDDWAGLQPLRIFGVTFGDGSQAQKWATVTDTGGRAEVLGNSFVGPTTCSGYGGPYCIYPWYTWDGQAFNYGVDYLNTQISFGRVNQFATKATCPQDGVFPGPTYCDTVLNTQG